MGGDAAAPGVGRQPEPHRRAALLQVDAIERAPPEDGLLVLGLDHRQLDLLAPMPRTLVLDQARARVVRSARSPVRELLEDRVAERPELGRHVRLAPGAQQHDVVAERRRGERERRHGYVETVSAPSSASETSTE